MNNLKKRFFYYLVLSTVFLGSAQVLSSTLDDDTARIIKLLMETDSEIDSTKYTIIVENNKVSIKGPINSKKQNNKIIDIALSLPEVKSVFIN